MSIHHPLDPNAGAPGVTAQLARALRQRGHTVDVLSFDDMPGPRGAKVYLYPWFVAWFITKNPQYDVADLSSGDGWVFSLLTGSSHRKRPVVFARSHGLEHVAHNVRLKAASLGIQRLSWKYPIYHGGFRLWECRISFSHANGALFLNNVDLEYAVDHLGVDNRRAVRVRNGIADYFIDNALTLLADTRVARTPRNIAFIGRYTEMKGRNCLRTAMRAILTRYENVKLGLFGTLATGKDVLQDYPSELRSRIFVAPAYSNSDLITLLDDYDILAFPSLSEGFPAAPLEAMACGIVPVVADSPGPTSYVINGHNGIVFPAGDAKALEKAIAALIDDGARWNALRAESLKTATQYAWADVARDMEYIYSSFSSVTAAGLAI